MGPSSVPIGSYLEHEKNLSNHGQGTAEYLSGNLPVVVTTIGILHLNIERLRKVLLHY